MDIEVVRPGPPDPAGPCTNNIPNDDFLKTILSQDRKYQEVNPPVCLERGVPYEVRLRFGEYRSGAPDRSAEVLIDSVWTSTS